MKHYIIDEKTGSIDYVIVHKKDKYILKYSNDELWFDRNGVILTVKDTGNKLKIKSNIKKLDKLEYNEATYLTIILKFIAKHDKNLMPKYKIVTK